MSNFGTLFRVTTFGESHCKAVGCVVDGVPPRMRLAEADIQPQLSRRRPGQSDVTTKVCEGGWRHPFALIRSWMESQLLF